MEPSEFELASTIWSNLVVASTAFVVLQVAAFIFLATWTGRAFAMLAQDATARDRSVDLALERFEDPMKREVARELLDTKVRISSTSFAWRYASLYSAGVLVVYSTGLTIGLVGLPSLDPFLMRLSFSALFVSLLLSVSFMIGTFVRVFWVWGRQKRILKRRKQGKR